MVAQQPGGLWWLMYAIIIIAWAAVWLRIAMRNAWFPAHARKDEQNVPTTMGVLFGGGVIAAFLSGAVSTELLVAATLLVLAGLYDDIKGLHAGAKLAVQVVAAGFVIAGSAGSVGAWVFIIPAVYWMNMYNFMDGSNGMMGLYALAVLITPLVLSAVHLEPIFNINLLSVYCLAIPLLVFLFGNLRKKALWIAGDTGCMVLGFLLFFLFLPAGAPATGDTMLRFLACTSLLVTDTCLTIIFRLLKQQNIVIRHQYHLYQVAVFRAKMHPVYVAGAYAGVQLLQVVVMAMLHYSALSVVAMLLLNSIVWVGLQYRWKGELVRLKSPY